MKLRSLVLAVFTTTASLAADPSPLFNAILTTGTDHRFVLVNAAGAASRWLRLGDSFEGYTLKSFEAASGQLEISREGASTKLTLVTAVKPGISTPSTMEDAEEVFRVMRFDEMMGRLVRQQKKALTPMLEQMAGRLNLANEDKEAFAAFQKKVSAEMMGAILGPEMRSDMAKIYSEVFTKEELAGLMSFYGTPTGQALIDKQPEVQQKMMASILPRMMQAMPRIQQMGKEFTAEVAARKAAKEAVATSEPPLAAKP